MNTNNHQIRVIRYVATDRPFVQGFADVELDAQFRLNGVNLMRDGSVRPGQLTPLIFGKRCYISSIEVLDAVLRETLTTAIRDAILAHLEKLPPEQRSKPPRPPEPRQPEDRPGNAPTNGKPLRILPPAVPIRIKAPQTAAPKPPVEKPKLPPPVRLLANFSRRP